MEIQVWIDVPLGIVTFMPPLKGLNAEIYSRHIINSTSFRALFKLKNTV